MRLPLFALVLAAACSNSDNVIVGGVTAGDTTPEVLFDSIGSAIHGFATLYDRSGNPLGPPQVVIILSDVPGLCQRLTAHRDYFRNATEPFEALIMMIPSETTCPPGLGLRLGTFFIGRTCDEGTAAEIVAASGPQVTTPFHGLDSSYIALTEWDARGNATGSFNILFDDPAGSITAHQFYGKYKTDPCTTLDGTLLP